MSYDRPRRDRVVIESQDGGSVFGTIGVSENIIEASWLALVDAFEYKLPRDAKAVSPGLQAAAR